MEPKPYKPLNVDKPGYTTSEFWFSVITVGAILLKVVGIDINADDAQSLAVAIAGIVGGFLAVWGIVARYIKGRSQVKSAALQAEGLRNLGYTGAPVNLTFGGKQ